MGPLTESTEKTSTILDGPEVLFGGPGPRLRSCLGHQSRRCRGSGARDSVGSLGPRYQGFISCLNESTFFTVRLQPSV